MAACVITVYGVILSVVVQLSIVSASGDCQGAVQTVTTISGSQTAANMVYQTLTGKRKIAKSVLVLNFCVCIVEECLCCCCYSTCRKDQKPFPF